MYIPRRDDFSGPAESQQGRCLQSENDEKTRQGMNLSFPLDERLEELLRTKEKQRGERANSHTQQGRDWSQDCQV